MVLLLEGWKSRFFSIFISLDGTIYATLAELEKKAGVFAIKLGVFKEWYNFIVILGICYVYVY